MTTKTISTYIAAGYELNPKYSGLVITSTGGVGGYGVSAFSTATVSNYGKINASAGNTGVSLIDGGALVNQEGGFINGGVYAGAAATVTNHGSIAVSGGRSAMDLINGGSIFNGSYADPGAVVGGGVIIQGAAGTLVNLGAIQGAVSINDGGKVTNGGVNDTTAQMGGNFGAGIFQAAGTVANFGTIQAYAYQGVLVDGGGNVTNGAVTDTVATIRGVSGVYLYEAGTVTNFGAIRGTGPEHGAYGVEFGAGGSLINGAATHPGALVEGYSGVSVLGAAGTVVNFGTIQGDGPAAGERGIYLQAGGRVTNGGAGDRSALIEGAGGVVLAAAGTVLNFGQIVGATGDGVQFGAGGTVTNGSLNDASALIEGYTGLAASGGSDTVTNFGTIVGDTGVAVSLHNATDVLAVEADCAFVGAVYGGGGTLDLASGTGTLSGLLSSGGDVTVSGSMATTTFQNFDTVLVGAAAQFTDAKAVILAGGQTADDAGLLTLGGGKNSIVNAGLLETTGGGMLILAGAVKNSGTISVNGGTVTVMGAVTGTGQATVESGTLDFASTFNEDVTFGGAKSVLELSHSQSYTATVTGFSKTGKTSLDLVDIGFVSSGEATFSGTTAGGVLTVTDGTHTAKISLEGNYTTSTFVASGDGHGGTTVVDPQANRVATATGRFIAAMAGLGAVGRGVASEVVHGGAGTPLLLFAPRTSMT